MKRITPLSKRYALHPLIEQSGGGVCGAEPDLQDGFKLFQSVDIGRAFRELGATVAGIGQGTAELTVLLIGHHDSGRKAARGGAGMCHRDHIHKFNILGLGKAFPCPGFKPLPGAQAGERLNIEIGIGRNDALRIGPTAICDRDHLMLH